MKNVITSLSLALLVAVSFAQEAPKKPHNPRFGASIGFDQLLSSRARAAFGNLGINLSPGFGTISQRKGLLVTPDFNIFAAERSVNGVKNRAFHVLVGPNVRYGFVDSLIEEEGEYRQRMFAPYAQVTLGLGYADVNVPSTGAEEKGFTYGVSFAIGTTISKNTYVETRFRFMPKIASYDFSTFGIELGVRF